MQPLVPLDCDNLGDRATTIASNSSIIWQSTLFLLGLSVTVLQVLKVVRLPELCLYATFLLVSWILFIFNFLTSHPRYSPTSYLVFYFLALIAELSPVRTWAFQAEFEFFSIYAAGLFIIISICVVFCMPYLLIFPNAGLIGKVGTIPADKERSSEDGIRLYQWLTISWISRLLATGNVK